MGNDRDIARLKDKAQAAVTKGAFRKALDVYEELEVLEPKRGDWSRRIGEMHRRLDQGPEAVIAWARAVDKFADAGFMLKAIAVCRMILRLDPDHMAARQRLSGLNDARGMGANQASSAEQTPTPGTATRRSFADISLRTSMAGAVPLPFADLALPDPIADQRESGVYEIPLADYDELEIELEDEDDEIRAAELRKTPLFAEVPGAALDALIERIELVELGAGDVLFRQGDHGDRLYVISEGSVAVVDEGPPAQERAVLTEGAFFGEMAIVMSQPRSATVIGREEAVVLGIEGAALTELLDDFPSLLQVLLRFLKSRLLENLMATSPLFSAFSPEERGALAKRFRVLEIEPGAVLVAEGALASGFYVLMAGSADVVASVEGSEHSVAVLGMGDVAGATSLLASAPAQATVRASSKVIALELPADQFRELIMTHPQVLMVVSEIADERTRHFEAARDGGAPYHSGGARLV